MIALTRHISLKKGLQLRPAMRTCIRTACPAPASCSGLAVTTATDHENQIFISGHVAYRSTRNTIVPAHETRNAPHANDASYKEWASSIEKHWIVRGQPKAPIGREVTWQCTGKANDALSPAESAVIEPRAVLRRGPSLWLWNLTPVFCIPPPLEPLVGKIIESYFRV